ncbi:MAG: methyltransferase domain-containing protein [Vicinamibacteria bacterium]
MTAPRVTATTRKLEIGAVRAGPVGAGFETLDALAGADHRARWGEEPLPFPDEVFGEVYASHVLEHVPWFLSVAALREAHRVLAPGGLLEVWVPDLRAIVDSYLAGRCGDGWRKHNPDGDPLLWLNGRLFTYGPGDENWHRAAFDAEHLTACLTRAGFARVEVTRRRTRGVSHGPIDLGALAWKAAGKSTGPNQPPPLTDGRVA